MAIDMDREGTVRGRITDYGIQEASNSASVSIWVRMAIDEIWNGAAWDDWRSYGVEVLGNIWVVKKDGTTNDKAVESLCSCCGWDGTFKSIDNRSWKPMPCGASVKGNTYEGKTTFKIAFLNPYDGVPGASTITPEKLSELDAKYGSSLRAIAATSKRTAAAPAGKPPVAATATPPAKQAPPAAAAEVDVPF